MASALVDDTASLDDIEDGDLVGELANDNATIPVPKGFPSLETRVEWMDDWEEQTEEPRAEQRRDRWYFDNEQWTEEERNDLDEAGQPVLTKNRIARKVNGIVGDEIDKRVDPRAKPRNRTHVTDANAATSALQFVADEQEFPTVRTNAIRNLCVEGICGALKGLDEDGKNTLEHIEPDRLCWDIHNRRNDFKGGRWVGIVKWMYLDDAIAEWPDAADALEAAVAEEPLTSTDRGTEDAPKGWTDRKNRRIKLCEMYVTIGRNCFRTLFTKGADIDEPAATWLMDEKQKHSMCPLVMAAANIDQDGNPYGVVRALISPQDEINKRASRSLYLLSVKQVIAEEGVVTEPKKFMDEIQDPNGFAIVDTADALAEGRIVIRTDQDLAAGQLQLMNQAINDIDSIGPSAATLVDIPNGASGRALQQRTKAASKEIQPLYEALRVWTVSVYRLDWLTIRQTWTEEKWLRIDDETNEDGYRFVGLNRPTTRAERFNELLGMGKDLPMALESAAGAYAIPVMQGAQMMVRQMAAQAQQAGQKVDPQQLMQQAIAQQPLMGEQITVDQVAQMTVDIKIEEGPDSATIESEEFEQWTQLAPALVQGGLDPREAAKITIELSSFRQKKRVLQILEKGPDPQRAQLAQQVQQLQMQMQALQLQLIGAQVAETTASAQLKQAQAQSELAEAGAAGQPEMVRPSEQIKVQREVQGAQIDAAKAKLQIDSDAARMRRTEVQTQIDIAKAQRDLARPIGGV